ncbi:MAG: TolC family protein [Smithella sp.]
MNRETQRKKQKKIRWMQLVYLILLPAVIIFPDNLAAAQNATPLTLQEGLKIAAGESRIVKIARFNEAIAESDTHIARAGLLPSINATAAHTNMARQPAMIFAGQAVNTSDSNYYSYSISIQQLLFDFRGSLSRYEASRMLLEAKKLDSVRIKNVVAFDFILAFYDYLEAQHYVKTALGEIASLESHNRDATLRYKAGVITRNDLLQVQVRLSDARQKHLSAKNIEAVRATKLNDFLLLPLNGNINVVEPQEVTAEPKHFEMERSWEVATSKRSEILIVDRTLSAVDLESAAQKTEFLPKFFVRGSNDYMENSYQRYENNLSLIVGVNFNLFEGGRSWADLQKSNNRKKQLLEQRARLVDEIKMEVQRYSLDLQNAYARILVSRDAASQARENLRINKKRYEEGEGTATEVLDAVTLLTTAETNHIRSVYDYRKAEAALHYALGMNLLEVYR